MKKPILLILYVDNGEADCQRDNYIWIKAIFFAQNILLPG
jgi:hypothetical protein